MVILLVIGSVYSLSYINEPCNQTSDCEIGYCDNGVCVYPEITEKIIGGPCNQTSDCLEGYCTIGKVCVIPRHGENVFGVSIKSGCTGLINCPIERVECIILCNIVWVLLLLLSVLACYFNKEHRNKLVPITALVAPIIVAIISVPVIGLILSIAEIVIVYAMKQRTAEVEY